MRARGLGLLCAFLVLLSQRHFVVASEEEFVVEALAVAGPVLKVAAPILKPAAEAILKMGLKPGGDAPPVDPDYDGRDEEKMDQAHNLDRDPDMRKEMRDQVGNNDPAVLDGTHVEDNGDVRTSVEITDALLLQAAKKTGNGFNIAKVTQMIDGGSIIGDFMNVMKGLDTPEAVAEAIKKGVLAVDVSESSRICDGKVDWEESYIDERYRILGDLGVKVDNLQGIGNFGIKASPELERRSLDFDTTAQGRSKCRIGMFSVSITPSPAIMDYLQESIVEAWNNLPTDSNRPGWIREYINFFNRYGTHVIRAAEFGGLVTLTATIDKSIMKAVDAYALSAGVQAFLMGVNPKEQGSIKGSAALKSHSEAAKFDVRVKGGDEAMISMTDREPIGAERIGHWVNSLQDNVARLSSELGTFDEFMLVAYGGARAPLEQKNRAKIFRMVASNTYMTLAEKAVQLRTRIGRVNRLVETTSRTLKSVKKHNTFEATKLFGSTLKHKPSKGAFFSAHCRNGYYLCSESCKMQSTLKALEELFFDVNMIPGGFEACASSCYGKFRDTCSSFPIAISEFASSRDTTITEDSDEYRKQGIVYKRTQNDGWKRFKPQRWMKRYLMLHGDTLSYSKVKMTEGTPGPAFKKKIIRFKDVHGIVKTLPLKLAQGWGFQIVTGERVFYFLCESEEDRDQWVSAVMAHRKFFAGGAAEKNLAPSFDQEKMKIVEKKIGSLMDLTELSALRGSSVDDDVESDMLINHVGGDSEETGNDMDGPYDHIDADSCWDMCATSGGAWDAPAPPSTPTSTAEVSRDEADTSRIPELDPSTYAIADHDGALARIACPDEEENEACEFAFGGDNISDDDDSDGEDEGTTDIEAESIHGDSIDGHHVGVNDPSASDEISATPTESIDVKSCRVKNTKYTLGNSEEESVCDWGTAETCEKFRSEATGKHCCEARKNRAGELTSCEDQAHVADEARREVSNKWAKDNLLDPMDSANFGESAGDDRV